LLDLCREQGHYLASTQTIMKTSILLVLLLASGCAHLELPEGRVMSANHSNGRVTFKPAKLLYLPGESLPTRAPALDYGLAMCGIYS